MNRLTRPGPLVIGIDAVRRRRSRFADWRGMGSYGTIGLEMVLSVLFGGWLGHWLDTKMDTAPYAMLIGFGFGVAAAIRALRRSLREMQAQTAKDGFRDSTTDRPARFALEQREQEAGDDGDLAPPTAEGPHSAAGERSDRKRDDRHE